MMISYWYILPLVVNHRPPDGFLPQHCACKFTRPIGLVNSPGPYHNQTQRDINDSRLMDPIAKQTWKLFYQEQKGYASPYDFLCDGYLLGKFFETHGRDVAVSSLISALQQYFDGDVNVHITRCCIENLCKDMVAEGFTHPCVIANCSHEEGVLECSVRALFGKLLSGDFGAPIKLHECEHKLPKSGVNCLRAVIKNKLEEQKVIVGTGEVMQYDELYKVFPVVQLIEGKLVLGVPSAIWNEIAEHGAIAPASKNVAGEFEKGVW